MTAKRIPLPSSGGSYTIDAKGKAKQVEKPTRELTAGERRKLKDEPAAPPSDEKPEEGGQ